MASSANMGVIDGLTAKVEVLGGRLKRLHGQVARAAIQALWEVDLLTNASLEVAQELLDMVGGLCAPPLRSFLPA